MKNLSVCRSMPRVRYVAVEFCLIISAKRWIMIVTTVMFARILRSVSTVRYWYRKLFPPFCVLSSR